MCTQYVNTAVTAQCCCCTVTCGAVHSSMVQVSPDWSALITLAEERKWVVKVTPSMNAASTAQQIMQPSSAVRKVQGHSVALTSHCHSTDSSHNLPGSRERQQSVSTHTEQEEAKVDRAPPALADRQLLHCTPNSDSLTPDMRKRSNSSGSALEAKRAKPTVSDFEKSQVQCGSAAATGCRDAKQLDCSRAVEKSEAKTTPVLKWQSPPSLLPTPPLGVKPGNLSLGFNAGPKRRVAHQHDSSQSKSRRVPSLHSLCPPCMKPGWKTARKQPQKTRQWVQRNCGSK